MNLRFSSIEVINISDFTEDDLKKIIINNCNNDPQHLMLLIPYDAKAKIEKLESFDHLNLQTNIEEKEDLEYLLEYIKNISQAFPNLSIQIDNSIDFDDINIPENIKLL